MSDLLSHTSRQRWGSSWGSVGYAAVSRPGRCVRWSWQQSFPREFWLFCYRTWSLPALFQPWTLWAGQGRKTNGVRQWGSWYIPKSPIMHRYVQIIKVIMYMEFYCYKSDMQWGRINMEGGKQQTVVVSHIPYNCACTPLYADRQYNLTSWHKLHPHVSPSLFTASKTCYLLAFSISPPPPLTQTNTHTCAHAHTHTHTHKHTHNTHTHTHTHTQTPDPWPLFTHLCLHSQNSYGLTIVGSYSRL